jgi:hypothetical protein
MVDLKSIKQRYARYDWEERNQEGHYLSIWLLIFGAILIVAGIALSVLLITGRIAVPYGTGTRNLISAGVLILGILLGSGILTMSRMLSMVLDIERNTRYAMNIWFILEEKDLAEEPEAGSIQKYPTEDEDPSCL